MLFCRRRLLSDESTTSSFVQSPATPRRKPPLPPRKPTQFRYSTHNGAYYVHRTNSTPVPNLGPVSLRELLTPPPTPKPFRRSEYVWKTTKF